MAVSVSGFPAKLDLVPGDPATCEIVVRNTGTLVDDFRVELLGEAAPWVQIIPPALQLLPGTQGSVQLRLLPPRKPSPKAGPLPVQLRVVSKEDPENSAVADSVLAVSAFGDVRAQLVPRSVRHRRSAVYELTVANQGNDVISAQVATSDPDNLLTFETVPTAVTAEPAGETKVAIRVRARKHMITGRAEPRPFQTVVQDPRWAPVSVDGTLVQSPLLPWWVLLLVPVLLVVAAAVLSKAHPVALMAIVAVLATIVVVVYRRKRRPKPPG